MNFIACKFWEQKYNNKFWMATCICVAECLCYSPEAVTTLLIEYTPTQNTKFKKKKTSIKLEWDFKGDKGAEVKIVKCQAKSCLCKSKQNMSEPKETADPNWRYIYI